MPPESNEMDRELRALEAELKRLEAEYNMFFSGRLPRPPWETRKLVEATVKRLDRSHISNYGDRFRFSTIQTRLNRFIDLWDRALRAKEEGRPGPFVPVRKSEAPAPLAKEKEKEKERVVHTTSFSDPLREVEKLHDLYDSLAEARREAGQDSIPFHKFAELIRTQVTQLKQKGSAEVAFRVALKDGKVAFTAKGTKKE